MADDLDFDSFENLDDLDWSELEKDVKENVQETAPPSSTGAQAGAPGGGMGGLAAPSAGGAPNIDINYLLDVNLQVTVEVGRRQYFISEILKWGHGDVVELEKLVGEPLNLLVNNKPVAKGEVVVINDKFALKITEILNSEERILLLNS
ncbi:MAG: flagellar motor switch protein FliN [Deltaproteobacteria bacterium]|nr:flagellar motor switch protein FliN [Deltaproteobacteria bacterium]